MMRYREVEDTLPYYFECLISLHIFFTSGIISIQNQKIELHITEEKYQIFKRVYIEVYICLIHTYLHKYDLREFLYEYVENIKGVFLPKQKKLKEFEECYYELYREIGNEVLESE